MSKFLDRLKLIAFIFAFIAMSMTKPYSKIIEVEYSLTYFFIFIIFIIVFSQAIFFAYYADNYKKVIRSIFLSVEILLLSIFILYFWQKNIFNSVAFLWLIPMIIRWYLPTLFYFFKKRDAV